MSDIRFNQWLHQSGTGGVSQVASGAVGVGTTNPLADFYVRGDAQITGILTAGHIAMGSSITFGDDDRAYFGDGTDLQIYHSGSHSFIQDTGTGNLFIDSNSVQIRNAAASKTTAKFNENSSVELYHNNVKKFETSSAGINVSGITTSNNGFMFGTDGEMYLYKGAANTTTLRVTSNGPYVEFKDVSGDVQMGSASGTLLLSAGGNEKVRITSNGDVGINVTPISGVKLQVGTPGSATGVFRAHPDYFSIDSGHSYGGGGSGAVGSASNPSLIFGGDGNTGLYHSASDTLNFTTGGTERLRIDANGYLGVGLDDPHLYYSPDLVVKAAADSGGITIRSAATTHNNYLMFADSNSGDARYDGYIKYNHNNRQFQFATATGVRLTMDSTGWMGAGQTSRDHAGQVAAFKNTSNTNSWISANVNNNTGIGGFVFGRSNSWAPAYIQYNHTDNLMQFISNTGERMSILSNGNICVGSNQAAAEKFQVNGGNIAIVGGAAYKIDTHPLVSYASFTDISGGTYAARLGSTGTSTVRSTQIYGGGSHIATFDGVNKRLGIEVTAPKSKLHIGAGTDIRIGGQYGGSSQFQLQVQYSSGYTGTHWQFRTDDGISWSFDGVLIVHGSGGSTYGSEVVNIMIVYSRESGQTNSGDTWRNGSVDYNVETLSHGQVGLAPSSGDLTINHDSSPGGATGYSLLKLGWSSSGQSVGVWSKLIGTLYWGAPGSGEVKIQDKDATTYINSNP